MDRIILASRSPRRKQLMEWAELSFEVMASEADESYPSEMDFIEVPVFIARNKAQTVKHIAPPDSIIIAADTVVVLDDMIIGKPADEQDAISILSRLSGRQHLVITGVVIVKDAQECCFSETTEVCFNPLSREQIEYYVKKFKPYDKAGAYAIQEWIGVTGIKYIRGDFYNVMGLPVNRLFTELKNFLTV